MAGSDAEESQETQSTAQISGRADRGKRVQFLSRQLRDAKGHVKNRLRDCTVTCTCRVQ